MSKKLQKTSLEAFASLDPADIKAMYLKIAECLKTYGPQTYEEVAQKLGEKPERVWKRMSTAMEHGLCYRNGERRKMESNRWGFVWVYGSGKDITKQRKKVMKGPSVAQFSKAILNQPKPNDNTINRLF